MAQIRSSPEVGFTLQLTNFLRAKEARPRTPDRAGFPGTQPEFPHRQIFHERNHRMYQRYRPGKLQYFLDLGPHLRILADEAGRKIPATDCFHHRRKRTMSLGNFTNGTFRLPGLFSTTHGGRTLKPSERDCLHQRPTHPLRHP